MKAYLLIISVIGLCMNSCGKGLTDSGFVLDLPVLPQAWEDILGSPQWRIEWVNEEGRKETATVNGNEACKISLPQTYVSAVSAFPFWPQKSIEAGLFMPAGAIFPYDASDGSLILSWRGGVDAVVYWELAGACGAAGLEAAEGSTERAAAARLPMNFNWPRFRRLFDDPSLNAEIRADPWLADWAVIAEKIVRSGFDKRRLIPDARSALEVQAGPGPWIGASPFADPLIFETAPVFSVRQVTDTWASREGLLRCNSEAWIFIKTGSGG